MNIQSIFFNGFLTDRFVIFYNLLKIIAMGRKSIRDERRSEIIQVFYQVAKKEGLENASIAKIATVMEVNPSLIMHYFDSRGAMIDELIGYILAKYRQIFYLGERPALPRERLLAVIDRMFSRKWNDLFDDGVFYSCFALVFRHRRIRERYRQLHYSLREMLAETIDNCLTAGQIDPVDPIDAANQIFVILEGSYYYLSLLDTKREYDRHMERYKLEALRILHLEPAYS
jgi:AcrR family transcriptional regulator